jgi:hypothetical protein
VLVTIVGVAGVVAAVALLRNARWAGWAVTAVGALNLAGAVLALVRDQDGAFVSLVLSVAITLLGAVCLRDEGTHDEASHQHDHRTVAHSCGRGLLAGLRPFRPSGAVVSFEYLAKDVRGRLAYTVSIERAHVLYAGHTERQQQILRSTMLFRFDRGGWKIIHRHADTMINLQLPTTPVHR